MADPKRGYQAPSFQERVASATRAKEAALEKLKSRPKLDPEELARRAAAAEAKEAAAIERRATARAEREAQAAAKAQKLREAEEAAAAAKIAAAEAKIQAEADRKAARDAKYLARKARRG